MIKKIFIAATFIMVLSQCGFSQISIKDEVSTDSVNLFNSYEQRSAKSSKAAMAMSLLLPGSGHQYLGRSNSALVYLGIDIFSIVGAVFCERYSKKMITDSKGFAGLYAGANGNSNDERYWQALALYDDAKSYNNDLGLMRDKEHQYNSESMMWKWEDQVYRNEYSQMRNKSRGYHLASWVFVGAMVLNRVVSIVDIRASTRFKAFKGLSSVKFEPSMSSDFSSTGLSLSAQF